MADLPTKVRPKFFKDAAERDYVEISIIGDPNTVIRKVTPEDTLRFPREWQHYQENQGGEIKVEGTALTDVPGVDNGAALNLRLRGVRTAEELAGLDEAAARNLGMGGLTFWQTAKLLLASREKETLQSLVDNAPKRRTRTEEAAA